MATLGESLRHSPFRGAIKDIPVLPSTAPSSLSPGDPMDVMSPSSSMGPPNGNSPSADRQQAPVGTTPEGEVLVNGTPAQPVGAAAVAQQPKVVQTAFIHKLYSMLEDQSIQHLISWSQSNEGFVMSPSTEFSKVLASYFKHTNISSFVRQLNMYGFHKVSDVFHTGAPDAPLWEFKHGNGNFKRGDLVGLREIKRRASRHTLIHRDSFSGAPKMPAVPVPPPPAPVPVMEPPQDPLEARLSLFEHHFNDLYSRLARTEDALANLNSKHQMLSESVTRCHQYSSELSSQILRLIPDQENPIHKDVFSLRSEIVRQVDLLRGQDSPPECSVPGRQSYLPPASSFDTAQPVSPRQPMYDGSRRPSLAATSRPPSFRANIPPHLTVSPRRYGSFSNGPYSPSSSRPGQGYAPAPLPPPPPQTQQPQPQPQHPLASASSPSGSLSRRHTSADIRLQGWQGQVPLGTHGGSPYASGQNSGQWPSSPFHQPLDASGQQLRDTLAAYELPRAAHNMSRQATPPPPESVPSYANTSNEPGWQLPGPRFPFRGIDTGPPTRRSSMASNVHSLLNPAETAEREGEDEPPEERKRKRLV